MDVDSFLFQEEFKGFEERLAKIQKEIQQNGYNLFTMASNNPDLKNFHSDIIAFLLNPKEQTRTRRCFPTFF